MTKFAAVLAMCLCAGVGFALGRFQLGYSNAVDRVTAKAELRIEQLRQLDEIDANLKAGCPDAALRLVGNGIDTELRALKIVVVAKENTGYRVLEDLKVKQPALLARIEASKTNSKAAESGPVCKDAASR